MIMLMFYPYTKERKYDSIIVFIYAYVCNRIWYQLTYL